MIIAITICYLSFFKPPQTELSEIRNFDKFVHLCMYGGFCIVMWFEHLRCHSSLRIGKVMLMNILPITMGGIIEYLQSTITTYRAFEWTDMLANTIGVITATLFGYVVLRPLVWKYFKKH